MKFIQRNLFILFFGFSASLYSQTTELFIGNDQNSLVIKKSSSFTISGLQLTPDVDFDLSGNRIIMDSSLSSPVAQLYLPVVYRFFNGVQGFSGLISIDYSGVSIPEGMNESEFKLQYNNGSEWILDANSSVNISSSVVTSSNLSSATLRELTISDNSTALPVTWLNFTAVIQGEKILLNWSTATEKNTKDYEIQRSNNGYNWSSLGVLNAAGNSSTPRYYQFIDSNPFTEASMQYYRILQRDMDGKFSFSKIISVGNDKQPLIAKFYPNPVKDLLYINLSSPEILKLVNTSGFVVWEGKLNAGMNQLALNNLPGGLYLAYLNDTCYKIIIQ